MDLILWVEEDGKHIVFHILEILSLSLLGFCFVQLFQRGQHSLPWVFANLAA